MGSLIFLMTGMAYAKAYQYDEIGLGRLDIDHPIINSETAPAILNEFHSKQQLRREIVEKNFEAAQSQLEHLKSIVASAKHADSRFVQVYSTFIEYYEPVLKEILPQVIENVVEAKDFDRSIMALLKSQQSQGGLDAPWQDTPNSPKSIVLGIGLYFSSMMTSDPNPETIRIDELARFDGRGRLNKSDWIEKDGLTFSFNTPRRRTTVEIPVQADSSCNTVMPWVFLTYGNQGLPGLNLLTQSAIIQKILDRPGNSRDVLKMECKELSRRQFESQGTTEYSESKNKLTLYHASWEERSCLFCLNPTYESHEALSGFDKIKLVR